MYLLYVCLIKYKISLFSFQMFSFGFKAYVVDTKYSLTIVYSYKVGMGPV